MNKRLLAALSFIFLIYAVANILSTLPSGGRFQTLAAMLAVAFLAIYLQNNPRERFMRYLIPVTYPLLALFIIVTFRAGFYQMTITTLIGNPIIALFSIGENIPIETLIK